MNFGKNLFGVVLGSFSNSVWITPNNLEKEVEVIIEKYEIQQYVDFFVSTYIGPHAADSIVQRSWNLKEIDEAYKSFIKQYSEFYIIHQSMIKKNQMSDEECFVARTNLVHKYRKSLFVDPGLPEELLPEAWSGSPAAILFDQYYKLLAEPGVLF